MSVYTVCGEFFRECCSDEYYAVNVLFEFLKDNEKRVAVDRGEKKIFQAYARICKELKSKHMSVWLKLLAANQNRNIEFVTANVEQVNERDLFIAVARRAPKPRKLIIWSFDHYPESGVEAELLYLDRESAKRDMRPIGSNTDTVKREEIVAKYEIKSGHGTNIIIGSKLKDSVHHLSTKVSKESAKLLESIADCVESSGSAEAGEIFDKLAEEVQKDDKPKATISGYVKKLFDYVPDMARIGKSVQETVEVLMGNG